jgi:hypothetical protein
VFKYRAATKLTWQAFFEGKRKTEQPLPFSSDALDIYFNRDIEIVLFSNQAGFQSVLRSLPQSPESDGLWDEWRFQLRTLCNDQGWTAPHFPDSISPPTRTRRPPLRAFAAARDSAPPRTRVTHGPATPLILNARPPLKYPARFQVYPDGSKRRRHGEEKEEEAKYAGTGVFFPHHPVDPEDPESGTLPMAIGMFFEGVQDAARAEVTGLRESVFIATSVWASCAAEGHVDIYLFTDSLCCLLGLSRYLRHPQSMLSHPYVNTYRQIVELMQSHPSFTLHCCKVKAHEAGIEGNDFADLTAKDVWQNKRRPAEDEELVRYPPSQLPLTREGESVVHQIREVATVDELPRGVSINMYRNPAESCVSPEMAADVFPRMPDKGDEVEIFTVYNIERNLKSYFRLVTCHVPPTLTRWRERIRSKEVLRAPKEYFKSLAPRIRKQVLKVCHYDFFCNTTANRNAIGQGLPPIAPAECPLCEKEIDNWSHMLLHCTHPLIACLRCARHQKAVVVLFRALTRLLKANSMLLADLSEESLAQEVGWDDMFDSDDDAPVDMEIENTTIENMDPRMAEYDFSYPSYVPPPPPLSI